MDSRLRTVFGVLFAVGFLAGCGGGSGGNGVSGAPGSPRTVFLSSVPYNGNLGGLSGADAKCQALANSASLVGTYIAYLSDGTISAGSRITHSGPYLRIDDARVADDWSSLVSGALRNPINVDESGGLVSAFVDSPWTGTREDGSPGTHTCSQWTTSVSTSVGDVGDFSSTIWWKGLEGGGWTGCGHLLHLYCIEQ